MTVAKKAAPAPPKPPTVKYLPRTVNDVIAWSRKERADPSRDWSGMCQQHCRSAYDVPAWAKSAIEAWHKTPDSQKHKGGKPEDAPRGALLYYEGGKFGHVAIATGIKTDDKCLSNDYVERGKIDYAPRSFARWGLRYVGWSVYTPFGSLKVAH